MSIIGCRGLGWSKDKEKERYEASVEFDTKKERDKFIEVIEKLQEFKDIT